MTGGVGGVVMEVAKMAVSQIAQNAVESLGLPPMVTDMLSQAIESRLGPGLAGDPQTSSAIADTLSEGLGLELNDVQEAVSSLEEHIMELLGKLIGDEEENRKIGKGKDKASASSGGWIMAIAEKMGELVDKQFQNWEEQAENVADLQGVADGDAEKSRGGIAGAFGGKKENKAVTKARRDLPSETVKMSAELQKFNMLMQSANSAIKTAGQSASTLAGRQ